MSIGVAFIGAGEMALLHAEALRRQAKPVRIVGAFDIVRENAEGFAELTGGKVYSKADSLLSDSNVDAVYICTRHDSHFEFAQKAIQADKAIFCEKPVSLKLDEVYQLEEQVKQTGIPFAVGFNHRFAPGVTELRNRLGAIGPSMILHISMATPPFLQGWAGLPEVGGGIFHCLGSHVMDLTRYLMGEDPETIAAFGARQRVSAEHLEDSAVAIMRFPCGGLASLSFHDQASHGYSVDPVGGLARVEAFQAGKVAVGYTFNEMIFDVTGSIDIYRNSDKDQVFAWGYFTENERFLNYLEGDGDKIPASIEDGLAVARMVAASIESHTTGRVVRYSDF